MVAQKVGVVGGLGHMLGPSSFHWIDRPEINVIGGVDRGKTTPRHQNFRNQWERHPNYKAYSRVDDLAENVDLLFVCCGKNGDDLPLIESAADSMKQGTVVVHMSTVTPSFTDRATSLLGKKGIHYLSAPLTGGAIGAEKGTMLILGSGPKSAWDVALPLMEVIGTPKYFGEDPRSGPVVKLLGQMMVFQNMWGIMGAARVHSGHFLEGKIGGSEQTQFFDFMMKGAGGSNQWEVTLARGVRDDDWKSGFLIHHAAIDAVYAADLSREMGLSQSITRNMLETAVAFFLILKENEGPLAAQMLTKYLGGEGAERLDRAIGETIRNAQDLEGAFRAVEEFAPKELRSSIAISLVQS